jgi:type VI secretion system protein ImpK
LFQSHVAGETFFDKLDQLLRERDPAQKSLAGVYFAALSLGFRGKYHGLNDHGKLRRYRQELFAFVFRQPPDLMNEAKVAFPDSYVKNLRKEERKKLTDPRMWLAVLALVAAMYIGGSHGVWVSLTSRLESVNQRIVEIEKRLETMSAPAN